MRKSPLYLGISMLTLTAMSGAVSTVHAASPSAGVLEEVVVTAQRRTQSLQDAAVPIAASEGVTAGVGSYDSFGNSLFYSPEFGADLGIHHVIDIANYYLSLSADASCRDEQNTNFTFLRDTTSGSYITFNLDATLSPEGGAWELSAFVGNLTDERYIKNSNSNNRGIDHAGYNAPQTYRPGFEQTFTLNG